MGVCNKLFFLLLANFTFIHLTLLEYSYATVLRCSASENVKWSGTKEKCVQCKKCHPGRFRNLTEPYTRRTGEHGAEQCIRCKPCPTGTYSKSGYGECIKCTVNCTDLDREFDETCSPLHDAKCGSCLSGFEDIFRNTEFPCAPKSKKVMRILETPKKKVKKIHTVTVERDESSASAGPVTYRSDGPTDVQSKESRKKTSTLLIAIIGCSCLVVLAAGFVTFKIVNRRRSRKGHVIQLNHQDLFDGKDDLSRDNDIEMDTFSHHDETEPKGYQAVPQTEHAAVRAELGTSQQPLPRPELTLSPSSNTCDGMVYIGLPDRPRDVLCFEKYKDICRCRVERACHCQSYHFSSTVKIEKSDRYVLEVAANVCHDPFPFCRLLGLEDPVIYQEDDTRNRDPERISQKDLIINLLHKWIEVKSSQATLKQLSEALCKADFHYINNKLYNLYTSNVNDISSFHS